MVHRSAVDKEGWIVFGFVLLIGTLILPFFIFRQNGMISATGWIVEIAWFAVVSGLIIFLARNSIRARRIEAATRGVTFTSEGVSRTVYNVINPELPANSRSLTKNLTASQIVRTSALDAASIVTLARAQDAIKYVLTSIVYSENQLERAVAEPTLRRHEWSIAVDLRDITALRREQLRIRQSHAGSNPGPLTGAVLNAQDDALRQKLDKIESIVDAMEKYAGHVRAADRARQDWKSAAEISKLNAKFTDLVAGTAADEFHLREAEEMTHVASVFQESLAQANLAARSLFLPDTVTDASPEELALA